MSVSARKIIPHNSFLLPHPFSKIYLFILLCFEWYLLSVFTTPAFSETIKEFYLDGNLKAERRYHHGSLEDVSRLYYDSGEIMTELIYNEGKREGMSIGYYKSGKLKDKGFYKDDKLEGEVRIFYPDGTLKSRMDFSNDRPEGIAETYYSDGKLQFIYKYKNGRIKNREEYDRDGKMIQELTYSTPSFQP